MNPGLELTTILNPTMQCLSIVYRCDLALDCCDGCSGVVCVIAALIVGGFWWFGRDWG